MANIVSKTEIMAEIDLLPDDKLESVHQFIKGLSSSDRRKVSGESLMAKLRKIPRIAAPPDFSRNIDLYLSGEKTID